MLDLAGNSLLGVVWCNRRCNSDLQPVQSTVTASALCICCAAVYVASLADCSGHSAPPAVQPAVHPLSLVAVMQRAPPPTFHFTAFEATIKSACETAHSEQCSCALCHTGCETSHWLPRMFKVQSTPASHLTRRFWGNNVFFEGNKLCFTMLVVLPHWTLNCTLLTAQMCAAFIAINFAQIIFLLQQLVARCCNSHCGLHCTLNTRHTAILDTPNTRHTAILQNADRKLNTSHTVECSCCLNANQFCWLVFFSSTTLLKNDTFLIFYDSTASSKYWKWRKTF